MIHLRSQDDASVVERFQLRWGLEDPEFSKLLDPGSERVGVIPLRVILVPERGVVVTRHVDGTGDERGSIRP